MSDLRAQHLARTQNSIGYNIQSVFVGTEAASNTVIASHIYVETVNTRHVLTKETSARCPVRTRGVS